ncbi:hypothetical protein BD289DRAFT_436960 [Coniella lustricola]|uniref:Uncharacterized protein n=1 Tax=Coniella lustricola TaxID=2025994 RepID=A0A2T3A4J1_9PEZI|nr:hypothetical protein BD289DRAFT_436960 [Coniella lustricola]
MAPRKRAIAGDSASQDDIDIDVDVDEMIKAKQELDKIRKDREEKRAKLQQDLNAKIANLHTRIQQTIDKHTQQLAEINQKQLDRLHGAIEKCNEIEQLIRNKLAKVQQDGQNLAVMLDLAYEYRFEKAKGRAFSELEHGQVEKGPVQPRAAKRARVDGDISS